MNNFNAPADIRNIAYQKYIFDWMLHHSCDLMDFAISFAKYVGKIGPFGINTNDYAEVYSNWESEEELPGIGGRYVCMSEFLASEYQMTEYMKSILTDDEYEEYLQDRFPEKELPKPWVQCRCSTCKRYNAENGTCDVLINTLGPFNTCDLWRNEWNHEAVIVCDGEAYGITGNRAVCNNADVIALCKAIGAENGVAFVNASHDELMHPIFINLSTMPKDNKEYDQMMAELDEYEAYIEMDLPHSTIVYVDVPLRENIEKVKSILQKYGVRVEE